MFHFYDYIIITIFSLLVLLSLNEIVMYYFEKDLGSHMIIEHMLFFSIGALSVCIAERILKIMIRKEKNTLIADRSNYFPSGSKVITISILWWKLILSRIFKLNMHRWTWITIACFLVFVWHIPQIFDFASTHVSVHVMQHFSFIMVGAAIFMTMRLLGESFNMFLIFSLIGMTGFGGLIFAISDSQIYETYSISSHHNAGVYMITTCLILLLVIMPVYLIRRTIYHINTSTVDDR
jgi:cytochrome c oxidase assembly factor CtaG